MIGRIQGALISITGDCLLVDVHGLGYEVHTTLATLSEVTIGQSVELFTHFSVREDAQLLYGFALIAERDLFRVLIRINGVGPKMALGLLSSMGASEFARSIVSGDMPALVKLPGIGKKTAERLIVEMKDKVSEWVQTTTELPTDAGDSKSFLQSEAESALIALGYKPQDASQRVALVIKTSMSIEDIVKAALRSGIK
ncbi:MAG: Holliday junction branch migration protein RuvA [Pseudomonadales bacterium]|nr:Holliday junction branch migration protein RuvA [Pseudomonadales bacterium]